jgi:hypothetical protein
MAWLPRTAVRRWLDLIGVVLTVVSIAAFAVSSRYVLAWVAIGLMVLLVVSLALTAREEHTLRVKVEGSDVWPAFLEHSIADGHTLLGIENPGVFRDEHQAWHEKVYAWLREHRGLREAQGFASPQDATSRRAWATVQVEFLEGLRNR